MVASSDKVLDKVIERVRKMWAKAESAKDIGSLAEAEAFAAAVQKTLAAYKLDMSILTVQQRQTQDPLGKSYVHPQGEGVRKQKRIWWIEELAQAVAMGHYCRLLVIPRSDTIVLVGRESDRAVAEYMLVLLTRLCTELCAQGYWKARYITFKETGSYNTQDFKESFYRGFVNTIRQRYVELRNAQREDTGSGMALVVKRSMEEVAQYVDEIVKPGKTSSVTKYRAGHNQTGYSAGVNAGKAANLGGKAASGGQQQPSVSAGQRRLS